MCFFIKHGEIRIMSEHASGMFIDQFKNWSILLSDFPVSRKGKSDASESLHLRQEKQISHHRWGICFLFVVGEIRTGHERSERNMPGACFFCPRACRRGARAGRISPSPPNKTPSGWTGFFVWRQWKGESSRRAQRGTRRLPAGRRVGGQPPQAALGPET